MTNSVISSNRFARAIQVIRTDVNTKAGNLSASITKLDHLDQREADELQTLKDIWQDRRSAILLMEQGREDVVIG